MLIEISGAGFRNKGAELMLRAALAALRSRLPEADFCMAPEMPYRRLARYGLLPVLSMGPPTPERRLAYWRSQWAMRLIPRRYLTRYNIVRAEEIDALVDLSGYAFGDHLELQRIRRLAHKAAGYARRGRPVLLLPQMFGPFEKPGYREAFREAMRDVSVAYARDSVSRDHAVSACGSDDRIRLAPDITIGCDPAAEDLATAPPGEFGCIVPNIRMLTVGASEWSGCYLGLLELGARQMLDGGLEVLVVVHETEGADERLARELTARIALPDRCRVILEADPLRLKAVLWRARVVVASRYHSLVSALSGGVPCVLLGWAHKYRELARDFGVPDYVLQASDPTERLAQMLAGLLDVTASTVVRPRLQERGRALREQVERMWAEVHAVLRAGPGGPESVAGR